MNAELITQIFQICIIPLLGILTKYVITFLTVKSQEIKGKLDNNTSQKYVDMINDTVTKCVIATNQTYVESLKKQNSFTEEAQKIAFEQTLSSVLSILTEDAKLYIAETTGDLNIYLTQLIEAEVNKNK